MIRNTSGMNEDNAFFEITEGKFNADDWKKDILSGRVIVVAVDGSPSSHDAFYWTLNNMIKHSKDINNKLALVHCISPDVTEGDRARAEALLQQHVDLAKQANIGDFPLRAFLIKGDVRNVVCDLIVKLKADHLIVGTRGLGGLKRAVVGSVSEYLSKNAPCTCTVVKR